MSVKLNFTKQKKVLIISAIFIITLFLIPQLSQAQENQTDNDFCAVYFYRSRLHPLC